MTKLTILSAVIVLSMMAAAPASAEQDPAAFGQFAQQNPSASAAMYPNANIYAGVRPGRAAWARWHSCRPASAMRSGTLRSASIA